VRLYYSLVDEQRFAELTQMFAENVTYQRPGYEPIIGRDALIEFYENQRVIRSGKHIVSELIVSRNKVAVQGEFNGILNAGKTVQLRFADFFTVDSAGLFDRRDTFFFTPHV
jgi:ketosteroid isomerase-like protein